MADPIARFHLRENNRRLSTGSIRLRSVLMNMTGFYWVLLGFTWFYWVLLGFTGFYLVLLGLIGFYWVFIIDS